MTWSTSAKDKWDYKPHPEEYSIWGVSNLESPLRVYSPGFYLERILLGVYSLLIAKALSHLCSESECHPATFKYKHRCSEML